MGIRRTRLWTFQPRSHNPALGNVTCVSKSSRLCRRRHGRAPGTLFDEGRSPAFRAAQAALWLGRAPPTRTPGGCSRAATWTPVRVSCPVPRDLGQNYCRRDRSCLVRVSKLHWGAKSGQPRSDDCSRAFPEKVGVTVTIRSIRATVSVRNGLGVTRCDLRFSISTVVSNYRCEPR